MPPAEPGTEETDAETLAFRAARIARLTSETGWLTLVGRHHLEPGANELPFGVATLGADGAVSLDVAPGARVTSRGRPFGGGPVRSDAAPGGPDPVEHAGLIYELVRRGENFSLRVRDPEAARRRSFPGTEWYPFRPQWKLGATFEPFAEDRLISIPYDLG